MGLVGAYLTVYNVACCVGWAYVLHAAAAHWATNGFGATGTYAVVDTALQVVQSAAVLEVVHPLLGLVRTNFMTTFLQVLSRLWVVWAVLWLCPPSREYVYELGAGAGIGPSIATLLVAWCVTEVVRYAFYAAKQLGAVPYPLLWLRYTLFLVLYPLGVASEMALLYGALPYARETKLFAYYMPNKLNFEIDFATLGVLALWLYPPGLYGLYTYMIAQRKKELGKAAKTD